MGDRIIIVTFGVGTRRRVSLPKLHAAAQADLAALLPSILEKAFKGIILKHEEVRVCKW